ncbi:MAG TPA: FAD-dependent oxidoreductase [Solirubrobacteraceae bacterium]|nr:FAD-dependent oxidoreductase [Solirubrobacteraceae bacterium]
MIGGGVTGLTTATLLQAHGYPTTVYATALPETATLTQPPWFASLHAAASILPHSVASSHILRWTQTSQRFFAALIDEARPSVRRQRHYELFEDPPVSDPDYRDVVSDFRQLSAADARALGAPTRDGASPSGWCFSIYFCEAPPYLRFLESAFLELGGECRTDSALPDPPLMAGYLALDHQIYVLCAGQASGALLEDALASGDFADSPGDGFVPTLDPFGGRLIRGLYLSVLLKEPLCDREGRAFSYNYTPAHSTYPAADGGSADVYCYPRRVGWLLGGSREVGRVDCSGDWQGLPGEVSRLSVRGVSGLVPIPEPVLRLNGELLRSTPLGPDAASVFASADLSRFVAGCGFRFVRDSDTEQVRVESSRLSGVSEKVIVHNYGHGGAGFTLSWGCALDVLSAVARTRSPEASQSGVRGGTLADSLRSAAERSHPLRAPGAPADRVGNVPGGGTR